MEPDITINYPHKSHPRKIVPLGYHLSADEDINIFVANPCQYVNVVCYRRSAIAIESRNARSGEKEPHLFVYSFGARPALRKDRF
jgi:hypothetical protein